MLTRAPVTIAVAVAAVLATVLLGQLPMASSPWLSWLVHTELTHLLSDVIPWLVFGLWLERRCGSRRWALWTALGVAVTVSLHGLVYPGQAAVYGLSAVIYAVAFAGLVSWGEKGVRSDPRRWVVMLLLVAVLIDESLHGGSAFRAAVGQAGRGVRFVDVEHVASTPLLHSIAAVLGMVLGLSPYSGGNRQGRAVGIGEGGLAAGATR